MATIVDQINNAMSVLDTTITQKRKTNDIFKASVKGKLTAIRALIAKIQSKFNELKNKQNQIGIVDAQMRKLEEENKELRADLQKVTDLAQQHGVDKAELQKAHDVLKNKLIANDAAMKSKDNEKQGLQASLEKILTELQDKIEKLKQLTPGDADILDTLDQIQKELAALVGDAPGGPAARPSGPPAGPPSGPPPGAPGGPPFKSVVVPQQQIGPPGTVAKVAAAGAEGERDHNIAASKTAVATAVATPVAKGPTKDTTGQQIPVQTGTPLSQKQRKAAAAAARKTKGGFRARYAKRDTSSSKRKTKKHHKHHKHHKRKHSRRTSKGRRSSSTRRSSSSR